MADALPRTIVGGVIGFRFDTNIVGFLAVIPYTLRNDRAVHFLHPILFVEWAAGLGITFASVCYPSQSV
ncbi:MAG: hypothetical protein IPJ47_22880 [Anaerolineales bacterium]|nr:hypothetical protein [Anaerolineales bacterium]